MLYYGGKVNDEIKFYTFIFINERFQCFDKTPFDTHTRTHPIQNERFLCRALVIKLSCFHRYHLLNEINSVLSLGRFSHPAII